jgi:hypothetical protein
MGPISRIVLAIIAIAVLTCGTQSMADQKRYDTDAYSALLKSYIERIKKAGGKPIIVSSVVRRSFGRDGKIVNNMVQNETYSYKANLTAYARAAGAVAVELKLPFIDLHTISTEHHNRIGRGTSMAYNFKEGDRTHFNERGAQAIVELILPELKRVAPELTVYLRDDKSAVRIREGGLMSSVVNDAAGKAFELACKGTWQEGFTDDCTANWTDQWFLDGEIGTVETGEDGMTLTAGPEFKNDAHHMVLWTKESFNGDLKIEYDYVRQDDENRCVNIIYIQATGGGHTGFDKDISKWSDKRKVPSMRTYFNNMHTYHISYAAFGNDGKSNTSYIRGRRYMPQRGLRGSELKPEYASETLFAKGVKHHITIVKKGREIHMRIENPDEVVYCYMENETFPVITEGRIGLRHMFTRSATYKNFTVGILSEKGPK